jgi:hypothetical protein
VIAHEHDFARARGDAERGGRERSEHVDDHDVAGSQAGALEQRRDADVQRTAVLNGRRPL